MRDLAYEHAAERARERMGWNLSRGEWLNIAWLLKNGQGARLRPDGSAKSHHALYQLEFRGRRLRVGFDEFSEKPLTLMPQPTSAESPSTFTVGELAGAKVTHADGARERLEREYEAKHGHRPFAAAPAEPTGRTIWDPPAKEPKPYEPPAAPVRDPSGPQETDLGPAVEEPLPALTEADAEAEVARIDRERRERETHTAGLEAGKTATEVKPMGNERDVTPPGVARPEDAAREGLDDRALVALREEAGMVGPPVVVLDLDVDTFKRRMDAHLALREHALSKLKDGRHYGTVPGVPRPFLWLPGADLLGIVFGIAPGKAEIVHEEEFDDTIEETVNAESGETRIVTFRSYLVRVRVPLVLRSDPSRVVYGGKTRQASMSEGEFRYQLKRHYNKKRGVWVEAQPFSVVKGKVYEQAEKRSIVQAHRMATGVGDRFTQDPDLHPGAEGERVVQPAARPADPPRVKPAAAAVEPARTRQAPAPASGPVDSAPASQATLQELMGICKARGLRFSQALKDNGVTGAPTEAQLRAVIAKVRG